MQPYSKIFNWPPFDSLIMNLEKEKKDNHGQLLSIKELTLFMLAFFVGGGGGGGWEGGTTCSLSLVFLI